MVGLLDLAENNLKANFCFERRFTPPRQGGDRRKVPSKMVVSRKAKAYQIWFSSLQATEDYIHGLFAIADF